MKSTLENIEETPGKRLVKLSLIVDEAEYWDGPTMIAQIFGVAKGVLTGQDGAMVDHARIALTEHPALP